MEIDGTQASVTNQPTYFDANHANYDYPIVSFDGTDDFIPFDGNVIAGKDYSLIFVGQRRTSTSMKVIMGGTNGKCQ